MKSLITGFIFVFLALASSPAWADGTATPDEAKALCIKAAEYLKANGPEKAFPAFTGKEAPWVDRDLYVFVYDETGHNAAHGGNPALVGKNLIDLKDVDGRPFVREMAALKEPGWIDYKWKSPLTNAVDAKTSYIVPVGIYRVGVGAYKK